MKRIFKTGQKYQIGEKTITIGRRNACYMFVTGSHTGVVRIIEDFFMSDETATIDGIRITAK